MTDAKNALRYMPDDFRAAAEDVLKAIDMRMGVERSEALGKAAARLRRALNGWNAPLDAPDAETKQACIALADAFIPKEERAGAHLMGLAKLVKHAVDHHRWHHDAEKPEYVLELERAVDHLRKERASFVETQKALSERIARTYVVEFNDANEFLAEARQAGVPVSVLQTDIVAPVRHGNHVVMRPALL